MSELPESDRSAVTIRIAPARVQDLDSVARLHADQLPNGFLSTLGVPFLASLYEGLVTHRSSTVFVALEADTVCGFVAGTIDVKACYGHVLRTRGFALTRAALPRAFTVSTLRRIIETLTYPLRFSARRDDASEPDPGCTAELLSIAVAPRARGHRIGTRLVEHLESFLREKGPVARYRVVTDATDPRSNAFYLRCGFHRLGDFRSHGHPMTMYVKDLDRERGRT